MLMFLTIPMWMLSVWLHVQSRDLDEMRFAPYCPDIMHYCDFSFNK